MDLDMGPLFYTVPIKFSADKVAPIVKVKVGDRDKNV